MSRVIILLLLTLFSHQLLGQIRLGSIRSDSLFGESIDTVKGMTFSLVARNKYEVINGFDFGLFANKGDVVNGVALGLFHNRTGRFNGATVGGIVNIAGDGSSCGFAFASAYNRIYASRFCGFAITGGINYFNYKYSGSKLNGCVISGLATKIKSDKVNGVVLSGLHNTFGNHFNGVAISAFGNRGGTTKGCLLGAVNHTSIFKGVAIGLFNKDMSSQGMKIGLINISNAYSSSTFSVGVLTNYNIRWDLSERGILLSKGFYLTGGVNFYNQFAGISIGGIGNFSGEFSGLGIAAGMNVIGTGKGLLISGLVNYVDEDFHGVSVSLINIGSSTCQLGLINISRSARLQIGLININRAAGVKVLPIINFSRPNQ